MASLSQEVENHENDTTRSFLLPPNPLYLLSCELLSIAALILANFSLMTCHYVKVDVPFVMDKIQVGLMFREQVQCDVNLFSSGTYYCTTMEQCQSYLDESTGGSEFLSFYQGDDASTWRSGRALVIAAMAFGVIGIVMIMSTTVMSLPFLKQKYVFHILAALYLISSVLIVNTTSFVMFLTHVCDQYHCTLSRGAYCAILSSISWLIASIGCALCIPPKEQPSQSSSNNSVGSVGNDATSLTGSGEGISYSAGTTANNCHTSDSNDSGDNNTNPISESEEGIV
mmetsp:Transcript_18490/g.28535  ORF Transcript_18490/g.28535 Transcript_18490/m.28535 type:complete len:284 (-) Transcript_18490:335-1186(-)